MDSADTAARDDTGADRPATAAPCGVVTGSGCASCGPPVEDDCGLQTAEGGIPGPPTGSVQGGGGRCASKPGPTGLGLGVVLALAVLLRRIAPAGLLLLLVVPPRARAGVDGQAVQILDGGAFPALWDARIGPAGALTGGVAGDVARRPVVFVLGDEVTPIVDLVFTRHWTATYTLREAVRFGVELPNHRPAIITGESATTWPGDLALWAAAPLRSKGPLDALLVLHSDVPTGSPEVYLGDPGGHITGLVALGFPAGPLEALVNLGVRGQREEVLPGTVWGTRLRYGLGLQARAGLGLSATAELFGSAPLRISHNGPGAWPLEALGGVSKQAGALLRVGGAVGAGLTRGVGSPTYRALVRIEVGRMDTADTDGDGIPDLRDLCRRVPEDLDGYRDQDGCPEPDNDGDGLPDPVDACPNRPEVVNGWLDEDGCPDRATRVSLLVRLERPDLAEVATLRTGGIERVSVLPGEPWATVVPGATATLEVEAPGHAPWSRTLALDGESTVSVVADLEALRFGEVELTVEDPGGVPLYAWVQADDGPLEAANAGRIERRVRAGPTTWRVLAEGYRGHRVSFEVPVGGRVEVAVTLEPAEVAIVGDKLVVDERVRFALDEATLDTEAALALDAVSAFLLAHPDLELVRVEGHADGSGSSRYNYGLSQRRAQAVVDHLAARGVARERLQAIGSGEALADGDEAASRRVVFTVLIWRDTEGLRPDAP